MSEEAKGNILGILFVAAVGAMGLYVLMVGFGKIGPHTRTDWPIVAAGGAFLILACSFALSAIGGIVYGVKARPDGSLTDEAPYAIRAAQTVLGIVLVSMLAGVSMWAVLNSGIVWLGKVIFIAAGVAFWGFILAFTIFRLRSLR